MEFLSKLSHKNYNTFHSKFFVLLTQTGLGDEISGHGQDMLLGGLISVHDEFLFLYCAALGLAKTVKSNKTAKIL